MGFTPGKATNNKLSSVHAAWKLWRQLKGKRRKTKSGVLHELPRISKRSGRYTLQPSLPEPLPALLRSDSNFEWGASTLSPSLDTVVWVVADIILSDARLRPL